MNRVKNFNATGIAPDGKLYAGDLNAIQDAVAGLTDFAQVISLNTLKIGDTSIQLLKFGTGEARLSSALRTDGIIRGLGGLYAGAFTTAQRDAIAAGFRPYGLLILNTDTNQYEWNSGTDAVPNWIGISPALPAGSMVDYGGAAAPSGWLLCDGASLLRASFAALFTAIGTSYGSVDGTHFNVPDFRGRVSVGKGTHANVDALGDNDGVAVANRRPQHRHTPHTHTTSGIQNSGTGMAGTNSSGNQSGASIGSSDGGSGVATDALDAPAYLVTNKIIKT